MSTRFPASTTTNQHQLAMKQLIGIGMTACALGSVAQANVVTFNVLDGNTIRDYVSGAEAQPLISVAHASGVPGSIQQVRVFLDLADGWNGDYYLTLSHAGQKAVLLNRAGVGAANEFGYGDTGFGPAGLGQPMVFSDSAAHDVHWYGGASPVFNGLGQLTGSWQPDGRDADPLTLAPGDYDTLARVAHPLSVFNGLTGDGDWVLYAEDVSSGSEGVLQNWTVEITTAVPEPGQLLCGGVLVLLGTGIGLVRRRQR